MSIIANIDIIFGIVAVIIAILYDGDGLIQSAVVGLLGAVLVFVLVFVVGLALGVPIGG